MARYFDVTMTAGTDAGPYTIYHTSVNPSNIALLYPSGNPASNLSLSTVQGTVRVEVPDTATKVIFYNTNSVMISDCPANSVEHTL